MGINLIKPNIPPNIERINKHLYGVRFSWVRVGWVKAFPFLLEDNAKHAFVTGMTNRFENDMDVDGVINRFVTGVTEALDVAAEGVHQ